MKHQIKKILVVDDEVVFAETIARHLRMEGYLAETAYDGEEAIDVIESLQAEGRDEVELVVTDINMPNLNGIELIKWLHANHPKIAIIVVTGIGIQEKIATMLRPGLDMQIAKPFAPQNMLEVIDQIGSAMV